MSLKHKYFHGTRISKTKIQRTYIFEFSFVQNKNRSHLLQSFNIFYNIHSIGTAHDPTNSKKILFSHFFFVYYFTHFPAFISISIHVIHHLYEFNGVYLILYSIVSRQCITNEIFLSRKE